MHIAFTVALLSATSAVGAQQPTKGPDCSIVRAALPIELAAWSQQMPVAAGTEAGGGAAIVPGRAVLASLHPARHLTLRPQPKQAVANGGTLTLAIAEVGTYRVALGGKAWIDVVRGGAAVASVAHGHGPACTGVTKMVDFILAPGTYTVQLSGSEADSLALLVAKVA